MDDLTFQCELHQLKQQVEDMAMRHAQTPLPSPQPSLSPRHTFLEQMRDLKAHLAGLDRKYTDMRDTQTRAARTPSHQSQQAARTPQIQQASMLPPYNRFALPSPPLFWQLFTSLRTDVQGLDGRVAGLEQTVSDLEDRVDGMDALRFTPSSSVASYDEAAQLAFTHSMPAPPLTDETYREAPSNVQPQHLGTPALPAVYYTSERTVPPPTHTRLPGTSELAVSSSQQYSQSQEENDRYKTSMLKSKAEFAGATIKMLHRYNDTIENQSSQLDKENAQLARTIVHLNAKLHGLDLKRTHVFHHGPPEMFEPGRYAYQGGAFSPNDFCSANSVAQASNPFSAEQQGSMPQNAAQRPSCHVSLEGAAFRDQEISRLDELLRNAQEDLLASEQRVRAHVDQHRCREEEICDELASSSRKDEQLKQLISVLQKKDEEMERLRDDRHQFGRASAGYQHELARAEKQMNEMQRSLRELQTSDAETDRMLCARSKEVRELQRFCDQKDDIVRKQEEVIARGAALLSERDDEIESLGRRLKGIEDDRQHEMRQQARLAKLVEERDAELSNMKNGIAQACAISQRSPRAWNGELKSPDEQLALVKARLENCAHIAGVPGPAEFDLIEHANLDGSCEARCVLRSDPTQTFKFWDEPRPNSNPGPEAQSWPPRPILSNRRLPHEARRASAWGQGEQTPPRPEFGKPSPMGK
ncbi:hypothetical protein LTR36_001311 [Oleoguttula mirabilis]|uniref:Uncharacterized protein n=1 Tax=Oleoguttula mirabilis TaxID=1507867 RepID=A0AAV9JNW8_9PEZI|nr:hypothetical protein LTR36_001311 [Oleoguttula mirabilis]